MESMDRSLRDLNVPFICLLEEPTSTPCNSSSNCTYGHVDSNNSSGAGVRFATGESDFHPTVAALLKFLTSLPATTNPDTNLSTSGAKSAGIFSLFTDDTYHPLSLFLRTSLVAQLPQMPIFCFDSESIVPPTAQHLKPIKTVNPTTSSRELFREDEREEFERLFNLWSEKAKVEDWRFGSRFLKAVPTGSTESRYGKHLCESRSNLESHLCSLSSCSDSSLKNTRTIKCVDLAVVRYIISLESVKKILSFPPEQSNTAEETMDTRVIIAGFLTGTVSPRRALLENDHGIKNAERVAMLNTKINSEISPGDLVGGEQKAENSAGVTAAVRSYLIEADQSRYSCFKEMKRGTLSVTRLVVFNNDAIASTSSSRLGASKGAWSSESTSVSLKPSSSVKWVIPWLQLLSPEASAILQRPNNFKVRLVRTAPYLSTFFSTPISCCLRNILSCASN